MLNPGFLCRRNNPTSKYYDWRLITERLSSLAIAREENDFNQLVNLLRSGLVRNLGNITSPKLYNRSFSGTKYLIEEYITQVAESVEDISDLPTSHPTAWNADDTVLTNQMKLDFVHDTRQAFGRSTLVLQGGAIFGLCHIGVVKALFLRGLLPRIITGTATGALVAALVAVHTAEELPGVLKGDGIDLSAFASKSTTTEGQSFRSRLDTLLRRIRRFSREGYFLDVTVLEECVRANVGDLTFEEAYNRSKRVLNITVATEGQAGVPTLLNYLTAPNVVCTHLLPLCLACKWGERLKKPLKLTSFAVDLDSSCGIQCGISITIRTSENHPSLQRRQRPHRPLGARQHGRFPPLDTRILQRP